MNDYPYPALQTLTYDPLLLGVMVALVLSLYVLHTKGRNPNRDVPRYHILTALVLAFMSYWSGTQVWLLYLGGVDVVLYLVIFQPRQLELKDRYNPSLSYWSRPVHYALSATQPVNALPPSWMLVVAAVATALYWYF